MQESMYKKAGQANEPAMEERKYNPPTVGMLRRETDCDRVNEQLVQLVALAVEVRMLTGDTLQKYIQDSPEKCGEDTEPMPYMAPVWDGMRVQITEVKRTLHYIREMIDRAEL